jgi:hypothetical protein
MAKQKNSVPQRVPMTGVERLGLRVSAMINHPIAQTQRWVTIHRMDTDADADWEEVMGILSETEELDLIFNDDGSATLKWERPGNEKTSSAVELSTDEIAPF